MPAISSHGVGLPFASVHSPVLAPCVPVAEVDAAEADLDRFHQNHATAPTATTATMIHWPRDNPSVFPRAELEGAGGGAALAVGSLTRR